MRTEITVELEQFEGREDNAMQITRQVQCSARVRCTSGDRVTPGEFIIDDLEINSVSRIMHSYSRDSGWHIQSVLDAVEEVDLVAYLNRELDDCRDDWREVIVAAAYKAHQAELVTA